MAAPARAGLFLNYEQAEALRNWWRRYRQDYATKPWSDRGEPESGGLFATIAPLIQPWRMEKEGLGYLLRGPNDDSVFVGDGYTNGGKALWAERILYLLNESEAKR